MEPIESFEEFLSIIDDIRQDAENKPYLKKALVDLENIAIEEGTDPDVFLYHIVYEYQQELRVKEWSTTLIRRVLRLS